MRYLIIIAVLLYSSTILAQNQEKSDHLLTGKLILTKDGMTIGTSKKLMKDTDIDFEFNGKELSVKIGTKIYNDVTLAAGIGIQPNGKGCVYMSLSDGIALGEIKISGASNENAQLLKVKSTGVLKATLGGKVSYCFNWINNKSMSFKPVTGNFQNILTVPNLAKTILPILHGLKFEPSFAYEYSREGTIGFSLEEGKEKEIESYCLEWEKDTPEEGTQYTIINDVNASEIMKTIEEEDIDIQQILWRNTLLDNFDEKYISESAIYKNKKTNYTYGSLTFIGSIDIFYFPKHESQALIMALKIQKKVSLMELILSPPVKKELTNGDVILTFNNDSELLEAFDQRKEFNFEYIINLVNK